MTGVQTCALPIFQNLVALVSNTDGGTAAAYIVTQIDGLDQEMRQLESRLEELQNKSANEKEDGKMIDELVRQYSDFNRIFPELSIIKKREFLSSILEKVVWDGELAHIYLKSPVHKKHRALYSLLWGKYKQQWETKFPQSYHRIAASARADNCHKLTSVQLK